MAVVIKLKRGELSNLPTIANIGEPLLAMDTGELFYGNFPSGSVESVKIQSVNIIDKGDPNGIATLDGSGKIPTSQLPDIVLGAVNYQGTWDASSGNAPALSPEKGDYYVINVDGNFNLNGITDWKVGDWSIYNGTVWEKVDNTESVVSVNGQNGVVVLDTDNIAEGIVNLYYTNTRVDNRIFLQKGVANGIAPLDSNVLLSDVYLPELDGGSF
ncbi:MAG: hypothetical protein WC346_06400 [Methanogenium sp.]|jgi:hypothetical protein